MYVILNLRLQDDVLVMDRLYTWRPKLDALWMSASTQKGGSVIEIVRPRQLGDVVIIVRLYTSPTHLTYSAPCTCLITRKPVTGGRVL